MCLYARERHNCYLWWNGLQAEGAVWHEREQKRREKGQQRVITGGGSVTGRSSLPRERPLQGDGGGNGYACHRAYWQSVSKATGRRGRITGPGTEKCPREKKNLLSSGFLAMRGRDIWSGWCWGGWQDHKGTGEWGRIYSSIVILRWPSGNVPEWGLEFEFRAIWEGDLTSGKGLRALSIKMNYNERHQDGGKINQKMWLCMCPMKSKLRAKTEQQYTFHL